MLILRNKGFHEFVFTILPRSLFNTLMDLSYSAFVSKLFISNDSLILRSCMLDNFASVFGCNQLHQLQNYKICYATTNVNYYQTATPVFANQVVIVDGNTLEKQRNN